MSTDPDFENLLDRLRRGDPEAQNEIFHRFKRRLIWLAGEHLDARLRQKMDPEDIMQSAFKSFFLRHAKGEYDLHSWDKLWSLLTVITLRKCGYHTRHFQAACRDVQRETAAPTADTDALASCLAIAREPMPEEAALLVESVEQLLCGLGEWDRRVVALSLEGYRPSEISAAIDMSKRSVYRVLEKVKDKLEHLSAENAAGA
jgi:RNA polymerase sigma-70 factor (ECF subfamily)